MPQHDEAISALLGQHDRLYRIELLQLDGEVWERQALFHDLQDREPFQIFQDILEYLEDKKGRWRMQIYYWAGAMSSPVARRLLGQGQNFLYDSNPRGDVIVKHEPPLEIDLSGK